MSTVCVTDADLVTRARQGDRAAFGELVDRHRSAVYRAARAALESHADAEDAVQEAFLLAFRRLDSFRGDSSFKTWLLAIAWRQALNRRRGLARIWRRMTVPAEADAGTPVEIVSAAATPEQAIAEAQLRRAIRSAIQRLSPRLRDALLLAQSGEYGYEEIAAMLKTPVGTVKWRVSEARRKIRLALNKSGFL